MYLALLHVLLYILPYTQSEYIMELRLIELRNSFNRLETGACCGRDEFGRCKECDPIFEVCVSEEDNDDCKIGQSKTKVDKNTTHMSFERNLGHNLTNPVGMKGDVLKYRYSLHFSIYHKYTARRIYSPHGRTNRGLMMVQRLPLWINNNKVDIRYAMRMYCSDFYYRVDCSKFCKPADNHILGHYTCDENGNKVCRKEYSGPDCKTKEHYSKYVLELRLIEFHNPVNSLETGNSCDGLWCEPIFDICVSDKEEIADSIDCNIKQFRTMEYIGMNNVVFGRELLQNVANPVVIKLDTWKGFSTVRFIVYDRFNHFKDTINIFHQRVELPMGRNVSTSKELMIQTPKGPQQSELRYAMRVYCSNFYYGLNCSKFCKPADSDVHGHYTCDENGNKVCNDGYIGADCKTVKHHSKFILELRLIEFRNPSNRLETGQSCLGLWCEPIIDICVSDREEIAGVSDCNMKRLITKEFSATKSVMFGQDLGHNLTNPLKIKGDAWKGYVTIQFMIRNQDAFGSNIINEFQQRVELSIATKSTTSKELMMQTSKGPQKSEMKYSVRAYCAQFFYGPKCTKFCKPADNDVRGHYFCDENGNKECRDRYSGPDCIKFT